MDYSDFQVSCHIVPSLMLFVQNSLPVYHRSFFSEVSARDVFLWLDFFNCGDFSPTAPTAPSLRALVPSGSLIRFPSIQVYHHHPKFFFSNGGGNHPEWPVLPYFQLLLHARSLFPFRRGPDPSTVSNFWSFVTSWTSQLLASQTPWRSCWIPSCFVAAVSGLFLIPFLRSGFGWCPLPDVHLFEVLGTTSSLLCPWSPCPLRRATPAWRVILPQAATNFFHNPQFPQAPSSGWLWRLVARCWPLWCFLSPPRVSMWHAP
jgi:hypothetical protein